MKRFVDKASKTTRNEIERLIAGESIEKQIRLDLTYDEIDSSIEQFVECAIYDGIPDSYRNL